MKLKYNRYFSKTVMIRMGVEDAIEVMEMMELRVVGAYVFGC